MIYQNTVNMNYQFLLFLIESLDDLLKVDGTTLEGTVSWMVQWGEGGQRVSCKCFERLIGETGKRAGLVTGGAQGEGGEGVSCPLKFCDMCLLFLVTREGAGLITSEWCADECDWVTACFLIFPDQFCAFEANCSVFLLHVFVFRELLLPRDFKIWTEIFTNKCVFKLSWIFEPESLLDSCIFLLFSLKTCNYWSWFSFSFVCWFTNSVCMGDVYAEARIIGVIRLQTQTKNGK